MKPLVEVLGPWLKNNGDGLMLWSVHEHFAGAADVCVSSTLGLDRLPDEPRLLRSRLPAEGATFMRALAAADPRWVLGLCRDTLAVRGASAGRLAGRGFADGRRTALLVDCSGYAYGDPWSLHRVRERTAYYSRLRAYGARIAVLPQAFGPFENPETREAVSGLLGLADLVFARDPDSRAHLERLALPPTTAVESAPDVTHLLAGEPPDDPAAWRRRVCIVPNARMLDKASDADRAGYEAFVGRTIEAVRASGLEPVLLVHEDNDMPLARRLAEGAPGGVGVVHENARRSKGMIGASHALVASRFHACVSGLAQAVPTIGTSWSHKYERLFEDYGCPDLVVATGGDPRTHAEALGRVLDADRRDAMAARLESAAKAQKAQVSAMWARVDALLERERLQAAS